MIEQLDQVCTFSENAALRLATSDADAFVSYNKRFLSRVTPGTWRVDSSNLSPQDFWNVGCQMGSFSRWFLLLADRQMHFSLAVERTDVCPDISSLSIGDKVINTSVVSLSGDELSDSWQMHGYLFWSILDQWWLWVRSQAELPSLRESKYTVHDDVGENLVDGVRIEDAADPAY